MENEEEGMDSGMKKMEDIINRIKRGNEKVILELERIGKEYKKVSYENLDKEDEWLIKGIF